MKVKIFRRRKSPDAGTKYQAGTPETQPSATESEIHPSHRPDGLCSVYFATASSSFSYETALGSFIRDPSEGPAGLISAVNSGLI